MRISPLQIGLVLAGLIILGGLLYAFLFGSKPKEIQQPEPIHTTVQVTPIHGDVSVKTGSADFSVIPGQQAVESGSVIKTSTTGRALIESASSHITRLDYSSEITITEAKKRTQVSLAGGAVWSRLLNVFDSGESYDVQTPNAIASVRGTSFGVWYSASTTILVVIEGSVLFIPIGDESNAVLVQAGYKATRIGTGPITVTRLTKADRLLSWVLFNTGVATTTPTSTGTTLQTAPAPGGTQVTPAPQPTPAPAPQPAPVQDLVRLNGLSPTSISEGSGATLTLSGRNLDQVLTVSIDGTSIYFVIQSTTSISASAPTSLAVGRHTVTVTGPNGRSVSLSNVLTVTARAVSPNSVTGKP